MDLTRLDRAALHRLQGDLTAIAAAAEVMAERGIEPEIRLTSEETVLRGRPILSYGPAEAEPVLVEIGGLNDHACEIILELPPSPALSSSSQRGAEPAETRPAGGGGTEAEEPLPAADPLSPLPSEDRADAPAMPADPAAAGMDTAEPEVADAAPPAVGRNQSGVTGAAWSVEEDARLVELVANGIRQGASKAASIRAAASALNRPEQGTYFRCHHKLKDRIEDHLNDLRATAVSAGFRPIGEIASAVVQSAPAPAPETEPEPELPEPLAAGAAYEGKPAIEPDIAAAGPKILGGDPGGLQRDTLAEKAPVQAGGSGALAASVPPAEAPAKPVARAEGPPVDLRGEDARIWVYLKDLGCPRGWDAEMDLDMCEAFGRGAKADHIALDLDSDAGAVTKRYRALTEVIRDDRGHMTIAGQARFIAVLRRRVQQLRQVA